MSTPQINKNVVSTFVDKPSILTIMSGGIFLSIILYFIFQRIMQNYSFFGSNLLPFGIAAVIVILSFLMGNQVDVKIQINEQTGWIYAENRTQYWEGNYREVTQFLVLQREKEFDNERVYTEYKLYLELEDSTSYEIPLNNELARKAIDVIERIKSTI
ncbi:MAG: hypothetical protein ACW99A_06320 [Candidatus Kariarchaeaceae archaeon]|jgi:hypothetical protein